MGQSSLEKMLGKQEMLTSSEEIHQVVDAVVEKKQYVEIFIKGRGEGFHGHFLSYGPETDQLDPDRRRLFISPLEPAIGNAAIRQVKSARAQFMVGTRALSMALQFDEVVTLGDAQGLMFEYPDMLYIDRKREIFRIPIVKKSACRFSLERRGCSTLTGSLYDAHAKGVCLLTDAPASGLVRDDVVRLTLTPEQPGQDTFVAPGVVRFRAKVRSRNNSSNAQELIGVELIQNDQIIVLSRFIDRIKAIYEEAMAD